MYNRKHCLLCDTIFYKKVNCSKKERLTTRYCSRKCSITNWSKRGQGLFKWKKFTREEVEARPYMFQKWHKNSSPEHLQDRRDKGWVVWNKWVYGYKLHWWVKRENINRNVRESAKNKVWRSRVYKRDNYTCQICWKRWGTWWNAVNVKLNADHIIPLSQLIKENKITSIEEAYDCECLRDISNGRTLCVECHKQTDTYGERWKKKMREKLAHT